MGVTATKLVLGDPVTQRPASPLLSISSMEQRLSPEWWEEQQYDLIVFYGGQDFKNIPVLQAIKKGLPGSKLILKMDASNGPTSRNLLDLLNCSKTIYLKARFGCWSQGGDGTFRASRVTALALAAANARRYMSEKYISNLTLLFTIQDYVSY